MVYPFARHGSERGHGHPDGFPVSLNWRPNALGWRIDYDLLTPLSARNLSKTAHTRRVKCPLSRSGGSLRCGNFGRGRGPSRHLIDLLGRKRTFREFVVGSFEIRQQCSKLLRLYFPADATCTRGGIVDGGQYGPSPNRWCAKFSQWHNEGMTSHLKRLRDPSQLAKLMIDIASGEVEDREPIPADQRKNAGTAALGRLGRKARARR